MTEDEAIITQLAEELSEAAVRCSKWLRFGRDEVEPGATESNEERLAGELKDVLVLAAIAHNRNLISRFQPNVVETDNKIAKVHRYLHYSKSIGTVE